MTYFLMLLFVWITLWCIGIRWWQTALKDGPKLPTFAHILVHTLVLLWTSLGTFFFHNMW
jgi:hypothetical protein